MKEKKFLPISTALLIVLSIVIVCSCQLTKSEVNSPEDSVITSSKSLPIKEDFRIKDRLLKKIKTDTTEFNFYWNGFGEPPCNPFKTDSWNCSPQWKVSHGTPTFGDESGQNIYNKGDLTASNVESNYFMEKSEGVYIEYSFLKDHSYSIEVCCKSIGSDETGLQIFAANGMSEGSNNTCSEDDTNTILNSVTDKRELYSNMYVDHSFRGNFKCYPVKNIKATKNYTYLWLLSRAFIGTQGTLRISSVSITDHGVATGIDPGSGTPSVFKDEIPIMRSNTSPSGIASCSSTYSSSYDAWRAFDGYDTSGGWSRWISKIGPMPAWIAYDFRISKLITRYYILPENGGATGRCPTKFVLQGSNGSSWVTIDYRQNISWPDMNIGKEFKVSSPGYYSKYRLYVYDTNRPVGQKNTGVVSIRQLKLSK